MISKHYKIITLGKTSVGKTTILSAYVEKMINKVINICCEFDKYGNFICVPGETCLSTIIEIHDNPHDYLADGAIIIVDTQNYIETIESHLIELNEKCPNKNIKFFIILTKTSTTFKELGCSMIVSINNMYVYGIRYPKSLGFNFKGNIKSTLISLDTIKPQIKLVMESILSDIYLIKINPVVQEIVDLTSQNTTLNQSVSSLKRQSLLLEEQKEDLIRKNSTLELKLNILSSRIEGLHLNQTKEKKFINMKCIRAASPSKSVKYQLIDNIDSKRTREFSCNLM
jgi:hypothetical protein